MVSRKVSQLGWFVGLWLAGVATIVVVGLAIKVMLRS